MMSVELCEPQLPPVSISIGMKATSSGTAAKASSYLEIIAPVMPAETISTSSHTMRCFACFHTGVFRYGSVFASIAAIFCMSSVVSSVSTPIASSKVTMPTMQLSVSTTGIAMSP